MDARDLRALDQLNRRINARIEAREDFDDVWNPQATSGDCEDYALAKRAALIATGWAPSQVLIAVVDDPYGDPHAVLIARTSKGDLVLDNLTDRIDRWDESRLRFHARQSARLPAMWVQL